MNIPAEKKQSTASVWIDPRGGGLSLIDALFNRFDGMYPNRWRAAFANAQAIANWREAWVGAFVDEALSPDDVARTWSARSDAVNPAWHTGDEHH